MTQYDVSFSFSLFILCALHKIVLLSSENFSAIQFTSNQPVCQLLHHLKALYSLTDLPEHICYLPAFCHIKTPNTAAVVLSRNWLIWYINCLLPFFSVCWLFSCFFLTWLFLRAETLLRKHLACMVNCLSHDYYIVWLHKANIYNSCFIPKCVLRSVLERFQITTFSQQTMLCENLSNKTF